MRRTLPSKTRYLLLLTLTAGLVSCDGAVQPNSDTLDAKLADDLRASYLQEPGKRLVGTWTLVSAFEGDTDFLGAVSMLLTFEDDGTYFVSFTNDLVSEFCPPGQTSCTISGLYTYTKATIIFNELEPEPGPEAMLYVLCGPNWLYIMESEAQLRFARTPPGQIGK